MLFADFEKAIHPAVLFVWPSVKIKRMQIPFRPELVEKN